MHTKILVAIRGQTMTATYSNEHCKNDRNPLDADPRKHQYDFDRSDTHSLAGHKQSQHYYCGDSAMCERGFVSNYEGCRWCSDFEVQISKKDCVFQLGLSQLEHLKRDDSSHFHSSLTHWFDKSAAADVERNAD